MTARLREYLRMIERYWDNYGYSPSHKDIADAMGVSINSIPKVINGLERAGYIDRIPGTPRNIRVKVPSSQILPPKGRKISRYQGVSKSNDQWVALCVVGSKTKYVGRFKTEEEAARAYDAYVIANGLNKSRNFMESI